MLTRWPPPGMRQRRQRRRGLLLAFLLVMLCVCPLAWMLLLHVLPLALAQGIGVLLLLAAVLCVVWGALGWRDE